MCYCNKFQAIVNKLEKAKFNDSVCKVNFKHYIPPDDDIYSMSYEETLHVDFSLTDGKHEQRISYAMFMQDDVAEHVVLNPNSYFGRVTSYDIYDPLDETALDKIINKVNEAADLFLKVRKRHIL